MKATENEILRLKQLHEEISMNKPKNKKRKREQIKVEAPAGCSFSPNALLITHLPSTRA
jgi:hypothetical protein